jgi:NAD/NADP transhydrogenase alpha subunit
LTNAISAVVIVGAILVAGPPFSDEHPLWITILGLIAIAAASVNIVSGFLITNRMLKMFKPKCSMTQLLLQDLFNQLHFVSESFDSRPFDVVVCFMFDKIL